VPGVVCLSLLTNAFKQLYDEDNWMTYINADIWQIRTCSKYYKPDIPHLIW